MLGVGPIMIIGISVMGVFMGSKVANQIKAYGQSAGYAEQALSSIKVVIAFGQELTEQATYTSFLGKAKEAGSKSSILAGMALGFFIFMIYASYAYAFFLGGYFVDKEIYN
jgi:ATP-binding cassette subfamily B (MDR/TAP) protein 1